MIKIQDVTEMKISEAEDLRDWYDHSGKNITFKVIKDRVWIVEYNN